MQRGKADSYTFPQVREAEYAAIITRRRGKAVRGPDRLDRGAPQSLFGVALSGGGIRSSSYCLGVLQALHAQGLIHRIDYLSTVSGGGHIGASMVAAMSRGKRNGQFPFADDPKNAPKRPGAGQEIDSDDVRDSEPVSHIRDHSRYLIPNGMTDILPSLAIVFRGLAVNVFLILALIIPLATITVIANPTTADLHRSILAQVFTPLLTWQTVECNGQAWCDFPFLATVALTAVTFLYLIACGLWRSLPERHGLKAGMSGKEVTSFGAKLSGVLIALTVSSLAIEAQGPILAFFYRHLAGDTESRITISSVAVFLAAFATATAALRAILADWIQKAMTNATVAVKLRAAASKAVFMAAGLIVPFLIYAGYLALSMWGISKSDALQHESSHYPLSPDFLFGAHLVPGLWLAACLLLLWEIWIFLLRKPGRETLRVFLQLVTTDKNTFGAGVLVLVAFAAFLTRATILTRTNGGGYQMVEIYLLATAVVLMLTINFSENANGLHRLYRERLSAAFRLGADLANSKSLLLSGIDEANAPYLLINATLNARQRSALGPAAGAERRADENADGRIVTEPVDDSETRWREPDPVKRGRNAEFFIFSPEFVGSDLTGYVKSELMEQHSAQLDLATAIAISGAQHGPGAYRFAASDDGGFEPAAGLLDAQPALHEINVPRQRERSARASVHALVRLLSCIPDRGIVRPAVRRRREGLSDRRRPHR